MFAMIEIAMLKQLQQQIALYNDMGAYKKLYELFFPPLYRFSFSMVKSKEAAEEIVSDVFIKIWQIRNELHKVDSLNVYLYVITKNFSLNYIAKNFKNPTISLADIDVEILYSSPSPEENMISEEMHKRILDSIKELPPQCRIIFQLVKEDGLKYKEVAAVLNISAFTVRNQVAIAMKKIAEALPRQHYQSYKILERFSAS